MHVYACKCVRVRACIAGGEIFEQGHFDMIVFTSKHWPVVHFLSLLMFYRSTTPKLFDSLHCL